MYGLAVGNVAMKSTGRDTRVRPRTAVRKFTLLRSLREVDVGGQWRVRICSGCCAAILAS